MKGEGFNTSSVLVGVPGFICFVYTYLGGGVHVQRSQFDFGIMYTSLEASYFTFSYLTTLHFMIFLFSDPF